VPNKNNSSGKETRPPTERYPQAVGCLETSSVASGIQAADAMLKAAKVSLLTANPICPGKYLTIVGGAVAEVTSAIAAGSQVARDNLVDEIVIPNVHSQVLAAFTATTLPKKILAIGMIETFSTAASIIAGDQAVKSAQVDLLEIRLARAMGGKGYVLLTGEVAAVNAALEAGILAARNQGLLLGSTVIPAPHPDLVNSLL
jgi:bacterial microcompartment shell protein